MNDDDLLLYSSQLLMPAMSIECQQRLLESTVLVVGAGGLGNTVAQYLFGSGVGRILIVDNDVVELSNVPRQILFHTTDIGLYKSEVLAKRLNQRLAVESCVGICEKYSDELFQRLAQDYTIDVIVDAGDNLALSYQLDDLATRQTLPIVHASVSRFEGHSYTRLPTVDFKTLRELFSQKAEQETCSQSGVLSVAVGLIGTYQATSVIKVLLAAESGTGFGEIKPELVLFDGHSMRFMPLSVKQ